MISPKNKSTHLWPNSIIEIFLMHLALRGMNGMTKTNGKMYRAVMRLKLLENVVGSNYKTKD